MIARSTLLFAAGLLLAAALPPAAAALRDGGSPRCAVDGVRPAPGAGARIVLADGRERVLCGAGCLARALAAPGPAPVRALVVDETGGSEVDAGSAWFVDSAVATNPANRDRLHAFAREEDARRHAAAHHGTVRPGPGLPGLRGTRRAAR
jgi:hypothetical protein